MSGSVFFGFDGVEFGSDTAAPYFANRDPAAGSTGHPIADPAIFDIKDDGSDVVFNTIVLNINRGAGVQLAYTGSTGLWSNGYTGTVTELTDGGRKYYRFSVTPPGGTWPNLQLLTFGAVAEDVVGHVMNDSYTATTADEAAPYVTNRDPAPDATGVASDAPVNFDVEDDHSGPDLSTLWVRLGGLVAINGGVAQAGFTGSSAALVGGKIEVSVVPDIGYESESTQLVELVVYDTAAVPNQLSTSWGFTVEELPVARETGFLEAWTDVVGTIDNEIGGMRATRLLAAAAIGVTTVEVETTHGWEDSGKIGIDGVVYRYSGKTASTLTGLTHVFNGATVSGLKKGHEIEAAVLDLTQTYSALDNLRRAMWVNYAEGEDLTTIGRNYGVSRLPEMADDDVFREVVKVLAYNPKGTTYGIELLLDVMLGSGNYEIFEDLIAFNNTIFVNIDADAVINDEVQGKAILEATESVRAVSDYAVTLGSEPDAVGSVVLRDERIDTVLLTPPATVQRPSAFNAIDYDGETPPGRQVWLFVGTTEATEVNLIAAEGAVEISSLAQVQYRRELRVQPESRVRFGATVTVPTTGTPESSNPNQAAMLLHDTARAIGWGIDSDTGSTFKLGLVDTTGNSFIGTALVLNRDTYYDVEVVKSRDGARVQLKVDGVVRQDVAYSAFPVTAGTNHKVDVGNAAGALTSSADLRFKRLRVHVTTDTDYWAARGAAGSVATASPDQFDCGIFGFFLNPADETKRLEIKTSAATNPQGGNNKGRWLVNDVITSDVVELLGEQQTGAQVDGAQPTRITIPDSRRAFKFPDDLGKKVVLTDADIPANDGEYVISVLRDPDTLADLAAADTPLESYTNVCEVVGASFASEAEIDWKLKPVFVTEAGLEWELSDAGGFAAATATMRQTLPLTTGSVARVFDVLATHLPTAQILPLSEAMNFLVSEGPPPTFDYYPFYLTVPWGYIQSYVDDITVAGVIAEIEMTTG